MAVQGRAIRNAERGIRSPRPALPGIIRSYHGLARSRADSLVLDGGEVPLEVLERQVEAFLARRTPAT